MGPLPFARPLVALGARLSWGARRAGPKLEARARLATSSRRLAALDEPPPERAILVTYPAPHVAHIQLNRARQRNAFSLLSASQLVEALDELDEAASVRALLLSGVGPDLTSGVDLKSFMGVQAQLADETDPAKRAKVLRRLIERFQEPFKRLARLSKPIVCVQHGLSFGLGMELAACSDIRLCSSDAQLAIREVLIGIAADVGSLQLLPRLVANSSRLHELVFTGETFGAQEALALGFVSRVVETRDAAIEAGLQCARTIASRSPVAVQGSKRVLRFSRDQSLEAGLDYAAVWNAAAMQSGDVVKAVGAILSKEEQVDYDDY